MLHDVTVVTLHVPGYGNCFCGLHIMGFHCEHYVCDLSFVEDLRGESLCLVRNGRLVSFYGDLASAVLNLRMTMLSVVSSCALI